MQWFLRARVHGWVTCPITENGLVRILGHPSYPEGPGSVPKARHLLSALRRAPGYVFWPDDISIADVAAFPILQDASTSSLTDVYLVGLAVNHGGKFATFDRRVERSAVAAHRGALVVLPGVE